MKSKVTRNEIIFQGTFNLPWHLRAWTFNRNKHGPFVWEFKYLIPRKTDTIFQIIVIILDLINMREKLWAGIIKKPNRKSNNKLAMGWKTLHNRRDKRLWDGSLGSAVSSSFCWWPALEKEFESFWWKRKHIDKLRLSIMNEQLCFPREKKKKKPWSFCLWIYPIE